MITGDGGLNVAVGLARSNVHIVLKLQYQNKLVSPNLSMMKRPAVLICHPNETNLEDKKECSQAHANLVLLKQVAALLIR